MSVLFVGHGSRNRESNGVYYRLIERLRAAGFAGCSLALLSDGENVLNNAFAELPKTEPVKIIPLMVSSGNHVINQIYGDREDSIKNQLEAAGFNAVLYDKPILEYIIEKELFLTLWGDIFE